MQQLVALLAEHGLAFVFLVTVLARAGAPVPASPLLVVAGGLSVGGSMSLASLLGVAVAANVLGDALWFAAGRHYGHRVLGLLCRVSLSPDTCVRQSEALVVRWGGSSLIAAKFVPGVSVVAAPMAGAVGMPVPRFVAYDAVAGAVWASAFLGLGVAFSREVQGLLDAMERAGSVAAAVLVSALAAFVALRYGRRRRARAAAAVPRIDAQELQALMDAGAAPVVIDVRSAAAAALDARHLPGALRLDLASVARHAARLPHDRELVIYCNCPNEASAAQAARLLRDAGLLRARPLAGGLEGWAAGGRPLEVGNWVAEATEATEATEPAGPNAVELAAPSGAGRG